MDVARQPGPDRGALPLRRVPVDLLARVLREEGERGDCVPALDGLSAPDQGGGDRAAGARHPRLERDARESAVGDPRPDARHGRQGRHPDAARLLAGAGQAHPPGAARRPAGRSRLLPRERGPGQSDDPALPQGRPLEVTGVPWLAHWLREGTFMLTYGDGVSDVNVADVLAFHRRHGKLATVTAVRPPARFGGLVFDGDRVSEFTEKPQAGEGWINGGFFVMEPDVLDYIQGDDTYLEREPLERLAKDGQLVAFRHGGFWQCMDTLRDLKLLESLWEGGRAPWQVWRE